LESVANLRQQLESKGSGLAVALGQSSVAIAGLCSNSTDVYVTKGVCSEEVTEEAGVERLLKPGNCSLNRVWGGMLYMPDECGCAPDNIPLLFTSFKNKAESRGRIRNPINAPDSLPPLPIPLDDKDKQELNEALKFLPTLEQLGYPCEEAQAAREDDPRVVMTFEGGEEAALLRLQRWMFDDDKLQEYFEIRNGMLGEGYSSKLSPWLALGCISPRRIWKEAQRYEKERVKNKSTYWLIFELTWRDFFIYMGLSQGDKLFIPGGVTGDKTRWRGNVDALERWKLGRTGDDLVDANMQELAATGFMSNRGRQNVASYLIFDLGVDWRYGAAHFEELLLDYDPGSNWGNWVAAAGLTGQRVNKFNTRKQLNDYDPRREYVNHWLRGSDRTRVAKGAVSTSSNNGSSRKVLLEAVDDKLQMTLDDVIRSSSRNGGKGSHGKGKGRGQHESDRKKRRWQARSNEMVEAY
jgi:deoxyribodipyrimidine photo-lyase